MSSPIACSLPAGRLAERRRRWQSLADRALIERAERELRYRREPGVQDELRELIELEGECCSWMSLRIRAETEVLVLEISVPPEARPLVAELLN